MKQTLFLATVLAATLGFSNVSWAEIHYLDDDNDEFDVEDYIENHDVDEYAWVIDADPSYYLYYGGQFIVEKDCEGTITNGAVANQILIKEGATLTMDPGYDDEDKGRLWQVAVNSTKLDEADMPKYSLHIHMENNATLNDHVTDLKLGAFTFEEGADVTITAGNLLAKDIMCEYFTDANDPRVSRNFLINANLKVREGTTLVMGSTYAKSVTLGYDQTMNLDVPSQWGIPTIKDGKIQLNLNNYWGENDYYRLHLDSAEGADAKLILPDGAISTIASYLGGTATISLGNGTKLQGRDEVSELGNHYVSWLTNNIEVRENCSATMTAGYYGGNITMEEGSSLQFDMLVAPARVDEEHWNGGVKVRMNGGNTLDLAGKQTTLDLTVRGDGNTVTNGTLIGTLTLGEGSYLYSDSAMASWNGPTSIVMNDGSTLEMATGDGKDRWINDVSKLVVNGEATVVNAYLRIKPGETYTLGNGVQNLVGLERSFLSLDNSTLDLGNGEISKLAIGVWSAFDPYNVIKNGKINSYVEIDPSAKLSLRNVKLGDGAYFTMKDNTQLDLGQAKEEYMVTVQTPLKTESWLQERNGIGLNKFTFTGQSARIDNGTLWVGDHISGDNETVTLGTDLSGTAAMKLDYDQATLKFGGHKWTMTQSNGTELFTMEDNGGYTGAITGRAEIDVDSGTQDKNHVQFKGKAADRPDWVQVQGVKLTTKSDFHMENAVISGSLIDIGKGTTMYLVNVEIKADTRFTDDTAMLDMRNTTAWLEQDVNTYVTGSETVETDTTLQMSGNKGQSITMAAGSQVINLTCDMFDSVTLDGTDLWLDMTDIAERGTLLGWDYFTLTFDSMTQEVEQALTYISTLQIFAKLVDPKGQAYTEQAYYDPAALSDDYAPRLFFKLVPTPEPTTGTLSLLALAALAARRRK
ncbi:MAG: hypothetical protein Q4E43_02295 [Akkermansia sp.]|nr:hypothetical protein [Akkermansia sp.]